MSAMWSYALAAVGILGIYLAGRRTWVGWAVGVFAQTLWIAYALATHQPGFIVSALAYAAVYGRNWWRWTHEPSTRTTNSELTVAASSTSTTARTDMSTNGDIGPMSPHGAIDDDNVNWVIDDGYLLVRARCCRDWPVLALTRMGRCGYCGQVPVVVGPW